MTFAIERLRSRMLVTGCAGFLGSHLSERLVAEGHEVLGVDCFTDYYARARKERNLAALRQEPRFTLCEIDLSCDRLDGLCEGVDAVFHLAGQPGVRGSFGERFDSYVQRNIRATQRLLEEAAARPVTAFVYASSSSVYGDATKLPTSEEADRRPISPYGMSKVATEELAHVYLRSSGVPTIGLRYFTAYGPRQRPDMAFARFLDEALAGEPLGIFGDGLQRREFTYVDDVVEATVQAAKRGRPGGVYNIGGGASVTLQSVVGLLEELLERRLETEHLPDRRGDVRCTSADISKAAAELGFAPTRNLREGLWAQLEWALGEVSRPAVAA